MAMSNALVVKQLQEISPVAELVDQLKHDFMFFYDCGFSVEKSAPSQATFSRLFQQLKALNVLFETLVQQAQISQVIQSDIVAIDASAINAYEHATPKKDLVDDGQHANWGQKEIPMVTSLFGLVINFIWQSIPQVNYSLPFELHQLVTMIPLKRYL